MLRHTRYISITATTRGMHLADGKSPIGHVFLSLSEYSYHPCRCRATSNTRVTRLRSLALFDTLIAIRHVCLLIVANTILVYGKLCVVCQRLAKLFILITCRDTVG